MMMTMTVFNKQQHINMVSTYQASLPQVHTIFTHMYLCYLLTVLPRSVKEPDVRAISQQSTLQNKRPWVHYFTLFVTLPV